MDIIAAQKFSPTKAKNADPTTSAKLCPECYMLLQDGIEHKCTSAPPAVIQMLDSAKRPKTEEEIAAQVVRKKLKLEATTISDEKYGTVTLATGGRPLQVEVKKPNSTPSATATATSGSFVNHMREQNMSLRQIRKEQQFIRSIFGRASVEAKSHLKIIDATHQMDRFFAVKRMEFTEKDGDTVKKIQRPVVYVIDPKELFRYLYEKNNFDEETMFLKIGIDDGQGVLKICLLIVKKDATEAANSVKDVTILGAVPQVKENYENVSQLWEAVGMNDIVMKLAADLKIDNLILGIQSHSSSHSCYICNSRNPFKKGKDWPKGWTERTLGRIRDKVKAWRNAGSNPDKAKNFENCTNFPLFINEDDDVRTIDLVPPCELHLLLGPVNHMMQELEKVWPETDMWVSGCNAYKRGQDHGKLNGNGCNKLLEEDNLAHLVALLPEEHANFGAAFSAFSDVVKGCFSYHVSDTIREDIEKFQKCYLNLNITVTPKVHIVFDHLYPFLKDQNASNTGAWRGLAMYSEQAFEAIHADFKKRLEHFKVNLDNEGYDGKFLRAVCMYNSLNNI